MCCALALLLLTLVAWRRRAAHFFQQHWTLASLILTPGLVAAGATLAVEHVDHYVMRAEINRRSLIAEILAQPICSDAQAPQP